MKIIVILCFLIISFHSSCQQYDDLKKINWLDKSPQIKDYDSMILNKISGSLDDFQIEDKENILIDKKLAEIEERWLLYAYEYETEEQIILFIGLIDKKNGYYKKKHFVETLYDEIPSEIKLYSISNESITIFGCIHGFDEEVEDCTTNKLLTLSHY